MKNRLCNILTACTFIALLSGCAASPNIKTFGNAIKKHDKKTTMEQIKVGVNTNAVLDSDGDTALIIAVKQRDINLIHSLMQAGANPFERNHSGECAAGLAAKSDNHKLNKWAKPLEDRSRVRAETIFKKLKGKDGISASDLREQLSKEDFDINVRFHIDFDISNSSLLFWAVEYVPNQQVVATLLKAGADPNLAEKNKGVPLIGGDTPLMEALEDGHVALVKLLIDHHANPNLKDNLGWTALDWIATNTQKKLTPQQQVGLARILIRAGANPNLKNKNGPTALHIAILDNWAKLANYLLEVGADPNTAAKHGTTPLMDAVDYGHVALIKLLIDYHSNPDLEDNFGWTALDRIAANVNNKLTPQQQVDLARILIGAGANPNLQNNDGDTAIHLAVLNNRAKLASYLLEAGADPNIAAKHGLTPLMDAVDYGHVSLVKLLINHHAKLNLKDDSGWIALDRTANHGNKLTPQRQVDLARILIEAGTNLNLQNNDGNTALHLAVLDNRAKLANFLLEAGADPDIAAKHGVTPLMDAVDYGRVTLVKPLIDHHAKLDLEDDTGFTALICIANPKNVLTPQQQVHLTRILIKAGANPNLKAKNLGATALYLAVLSNRAKLASYLMNAGANPNVVSSDSWTPLMQAVNDGSESMVRLLLKHHANVGSQTDDGWAAIHFTVNKSAKESDSEMAKLASLLLRHGANVNQLNNALMTPLMLAAANDRPKVASVLLAHGAKLNITDKYGRMALDIAKSGGNYDVAALIEQKKIDSGSADNGSFRNTLFSLRQVASDGSVTYRIHCNNGDCYRTYSSSHPRVRQFVT